MEFLNMLIETSINNCLYLALKAGGLSDIKIQQLILTLQHRTIHECDLENVCNVLEFHRAYPIKKQW